MAIAEQPDEILRRWLECRVPELAATVYRLMGINTNLDLRIRPFIGAAAPVAELV